MGAAPASGQHAAALANPASYTHSDTNPNITTHHCAVRHPCSDQYRASDGAAAAPAKRHTRAIRHSSAYGLSMSNAHPMR